MKKFKFLPVFWLLALETGAPAADPAWRVLRAPEEGLRSNFVRALEVSGDRLFAATEKGVSYLSTLRKKTGDFSGKKLPAGAINAMKTVGDSLWIGTAAGLGVIHVNTGETAIFPPEATGIGNAVTCIAAEQNEVWVGTDGGGVFLYDRLTRTWEKFTRKEGLGSDNINAIFAERDTVWFATGGQGLSLYLKREARWLTWTRYDGLSHNTVNAIVRMGHTFFFATHQGLTIFDKRTRSFDIKREKDGLADDLVLTAAADGAYLWLGGLAGLTRYSAEDGGMQVLGPREGAPAGGVGPLAVLGNSLFAGTDGDGLYTYNKALPSASIDALTVSGKSVHITGQAFSMAEKASYQIYYYKPALPDMRFGKGFHVSEVGSGAGLLGELDLREFIDGDYIMELLVQTAGGLRNLFKLPFTLDTFDPEIEIEKPSDFTRDPAVEVRGRFKEKNVSAILLYPGGFPAQVDDIKRTFSGTVDLPARGRTLVRAVIYDRSGRSGSAERAVYWAPEALKLTFEECPTHTNETALSLRGRFSSGAPLKSLTVTPGRPRLSVDSLLNTFNVQIDLPAEGENAFVFNARDEAGNAVTEPLKIICDRTGPSIALSNLKPCVPDSQIKIEGSLSEPAAGDLFLMPGGVKVALDESRMRFSLSAKLRAGRNDFVLSAFDQAGNPGQTAFTVDRDVVVPRLLPPLVPELVRDAFYTLAGKFDEDNIDRVIVDPGAIPAQVTPQEYGYTAPLKLENGDNTFTVTATDKAGNSAKITLVIKARLEDEERVIRLLREEISALDRKVDSLTRATSEGPRSFVVTEMAALKREIERLSREKSEFQGQMEFLKSILQTGRAVKPEEVMQKLGKGDYDLPKGQIIYIAKKGEQLKEIARRFYGDESKTAFLAKLNGVENPDALDEGRRIVVPVVGDVYVGREKNR